VADNEHEFDVVVVGSGAAGMTAALTAAHHGLSAVVVEKADTFGGSTARSGGGLWIPNNVVLRRAGVTDNAADAQRYLEHVVGSDVPVPKLYGFLEHGPAMLAFVLAHSPVRFAWVPGYADYYPEAPGGLPGGRTIEPRPFDGRRLGAELRHLARPYIAATDNVTVTARDYKWLSLGMRHPRAAMAGARVAGRWLVSKVLRRHTLGLGQALAAGLRVGLADLGVPVRLGTPMTGLEYDGERVVGIHTPDGLIRARRGVLLATGGFEHNEAMRRKYQPEPTPKWTVGAPGNVGEGINAGEELGAALDLMDDAWWGPSIPLPGGPFFLLAERSLPGCLVVNGAGRRYVNEAAPYVDVVHAMYDNHSDEVSHVPSWLVFDQRYRDRYMFAGKPPRRPLSRRWYDAGILHRSSTLDGLAEKAGLPGLADTVARFNAFAATGNDEDFGKGDSAYDRYYGDPRNRPNPCLGALVKPPFYAIQLVPGDLGTKGGLRTDERSRVLRADDTPIPGLYAAGNASAAVMGHSYAGAGATIGPAMTFGYVAALDMADWPLTD
jgi:3-oxosteroid 1-dehydrogenase